MYQVFLKNPKVGLGQKTVFIVREDSRINVYNYSQSFHLWCVHPPNVSIEDQVVHPFPVRCMLRDRCWLDHAVTDAMNVWVI